MSPEAGLECDANPTINTPSQEKRMLKRDMNIADYDAELWSAITAETVRQEEHIDRITSYNVCYTKLLRTTAQLKSTQTKATHATTAQLKSRNNFV